MSERGLISWSEGAWTTPPADAYEDDADLVVKSVKGSDAWRHTSYGFVHESEHALLAPFAPGSAIEVEFTAALSEQFDQAGLFVRASHEHWVKTGTEFADGTTQLGAVVTDVRSDWSSAPHPDWQDQRVTMRASWTGEALTIRASVNGGPMQLVRVAPFAHTGPVEAGPYTCAPNQAELKIRFHSWQITDADVGLHE